MVVSWMVRSDGYAEIFGSEVEGGKVVMMGSSVGVKVGGSVMIELFDDVDVERITRSLDVEVGASVVMVVFENGVVALEC